MQLPPEDVVRLAADHIRGTSRNDEARIGVGVVVPALVNQDRCTVDVDVLCSNRMRMGNRKWFAVAVCIIGATNATSQDVVPIAINAW